MKQNLLKAIFLASTLIFANSSLWAQETPAAPVVVDTQQPDSTSTSFKKLELEQSLEKKIRQSLESILSPGSFFVSVQVKLAADDPVNPAKSTDSNSASANGTTDLSALKSDLPLSKLGFWQPLLQEMNAKPAGRSPASVESTEAAPLRIAQIDVKAVVDASVAETKKVMVQDLVGRAVDGFSRSKPIVVVESGDLLGTQARAPKPLTDWILEFKDGISVLAATFVAVFFLSLIVFLVAKDFTKLFKRGVDTVESYINFQKESGAASNSRDESFTGEPNVAAAQTSAVAPIQTLSLSGQEPTKDDGFSKFQELYSKKPEVAVNLVKKWIGSGSSLDAKALMVLGQRASVEELHDIFGTLPSDLKKACKKMISQPLGADAYVEGIDYMRRQVAEQYVSEKPSLPESTLALLETLTTKEFFDLAAEDSETGALLLSVLPTAKVSAILSNISTDLFKLLSEKTGTIFDKDLAQESQKMETAIRAIREKQIKKSLFMEKSVELIPTASPEKEVLLYQLLVQAGDLDVVRETAMKYMPSSLVLKMPNEVIQRILTKMASNERAELIASQPEDRASFLVGTLGQPGAKLRDLVEAEVNDVRADALRLEALKEESETLWATFVSNLRNLQRSNPAFARSLKPIVNRWVREISETTAGDRSEALSNAA